MKILVIEDNEKHVEDAKESLRDVINSQGLEVRYVKTLEEAKKELQKEKYEGVLSDLFFPKEKGGRTELCGIEIGERAFQKGIPVVLITSTFHHDENTEPANQWCKHKRVPLLDRMPDHKPQGEYKFWLDGFFYTLRVSEATKREFFNITPDGIKRGRNAKRGLYSAPRIILRDENGDFTEYTLEDARRKKRNLLSIWKRNTRKRSKDSNAAEFDLEMIEKYLYL